MTKKSDAPAIRFKGFSDAWEQRKVGDLLIERNQQAPMSDEYPLMAFIANEGVAPKGERYDRSALVTDTVNKLYKKTEKGDFIYSSNNLETGSIGLNKYGKACISPVYSIFEPTGIADSDFLGRRLVRKDFINAMVKWRQGVIYGQWRIHESDFLKIEITVPSVEEQRKIGTYLDQLDHLITLHQRKCANLCSPSQVVFSLLFVTSTFSWEQRKLGELALFNPKDELPQTFEYVDLESVVGTEMLSHRTEVKSSAPSRAQRLAHTGDLFYQTVRPYQKNNYLFEKPDNNYVFSTGYAQMRPYVDGYFLLSLVQSERFVKVVLDNCTGTSYPAINANDLAEIEVAAPSDESEAQKIGTIFRSIDNLITLHQRECISFTGRADRLILTANKKRTTSSWEQRKAIDIADYSKGNGYSKGDLTDAGTPIILYGRLYTKYQFAISEVDTFAFPRNGAVYSQGNEVIVPASGETAEDIARASAVEKSGVLLGGDLNILRPFDFINPLFLALAISNGEPQKELAKKAQGKSVVHIHNTDIQEVTIAYPSRTEQDRIVSVFRQLDNLITLHQRQPFFIQPRIFL